MATPPLSEFDLIKKYFQPLGVTLNANGSDGDTPCVVKGIGDDGAVLSIPQGQQLVSVIDTLIEGVHFPCDIPPEALGIRVLAVNLSDLAAMGATPCWYSLALTLPSLDAKWIEKFSQGLHTQAKAAGDIPLIGGDTTKGPLTITIHAEGLVPKGQGLYRSGAKVGDVIAVSGTLGDGAGGLACLIDAIPSTDDTEYLIKRFYTPEIDFALSQALLGVAHSAMDVSDGLLQDLQHICNASNVGAVIYCEKLPIAKALLTVFDFDKSVQYALSGGDDYRLLFTLPKLQAENLQQQGYAVTVIGEITKEKNIVVWQSDKKLDVSNKGYQHF